MGHPKVVPVIMEHMTKELETEHPYQVIRSSYRASEIGKCPRYQAYKQLGFKQEKINAQLSLLFRMGHIVEEEVVGLLRRSGFVVTNQQHVGFKTFTVDGTTINVTASLDILLDGKYIMDAKSTNFFTFKYLTKDYILKKYKTYYDQIQTYLNVVEGPGISEWGCLLFYEKMTSRLAEFWFKRDKHYFENDIIPRLIKIEKAVLQRKIIPRPKGFTSSTQDCERCPMRLPCWKKPMKVRD